MENNLKVVTPSRKRKREIEHNLPTTTTTTSATAAPACFTNAAFSSTPIKRFGKRRLTQINKENTKSFQRNPCLEVKSIADIVSEAQKAKQQPQPQLKENVDADELLPKNPFEVVRKPPKKKKRESGIAEACFENPALNLEIPEKQFNPYEVVREVVPSSPSACRQGFINAALNIRGKDVPASRNPFEIQRCPVVDTSSVGMENPVAMAQPKLSNLKIGIPFVPTVGCRIDFSNLSLSQLTPSKLLAEKLVFSPVGVVRPKRSLDSISEEESSVSIGKELDRYQLELENSINEAKLRKRTGAIELKTEETRLQIHLEQKVSIPQMLSEIVEDDEEEEIGIAVDEKRETDIQDGEIMETKVDHNCNEEQPPIGDIEKENEEMEKEIDESDAYDANDAHNDVTFASESEAEEDLDFKAPAPFVRAYRREADPKASKESLNSLKSNKSEEPNDLKKSSNVKNLIRKSIRKLMHPMHSKSEKVDDDLNQPPEHEDHDKHEKHHNFINTIRHSLRRKPTRQLLVEDPTLMEADVSIIDASERTMKLKTLLPQTEYAKIEELTNEKKHSLRHSIRRSTREMMKTVFHKKQEEYVFRK